MERAKPLFRLVRSSASHGQQVELAFEVQKLFFVAAKNGFGSNGFRREYGPTIEAMKESMVEQGVAVEAPAWFAELFR